MNQLEQLTAKVNELREKVRPTVEKANQVYSRAKETWISYWPWIWRFRKVIFAIPVVYLAFYFARLNWNVLPDLVGLNLQTNGDYARYLSKEIAVWGPLGITGGCLAMMFLSRKTVYPWMICMFSMLLPLLILVSNIFPA